MAHKKAAGSAKNLRDSKPKYRGVKIFGGQKTSAGSIIVRQKGSKYESGKNTYYGKDFSIHAEIDGVVHFSKANKTRFDGRKYLKTIVNVVQAIEVEDKDITKIVAKKEVEQKVEVTKAVAKKEVEKKPSVKKAPVAKKEVEKKPVAKKAPVKKAAPKKVSK